MATETKIPLAELPRIIPSGIPGVDVTAQLSPSDGGFRVKARLTLHAVGVVSHEELERRGPAAVLDVVPYLVRVLFQYAGLRAVEQVDDDLVDLGQQFVDERGRMGTISAIVRRTGRNQVPVVVTICWPDGTAPEYDVDDVLDYIATKRWRLP